MSFNKFNKSSRFTYKMPADAPFCKLEALYSINGADHKYELKGLYINTKGEFGDQPVALIEGRFVNLPSHLMDSVKEILEDEDAIDLINEGHAGFKIRTYEDRNGVNRYSVEWIDL